MNPTLRSSALLCSGLVMLLTAACSDQGLSEQIVANPGQANALVEPTAIDLGVLAAGSQATAQLTVHNTGDANLHIDSLALDHDDSGLSLVTPDLPATLAPGTSLQALLTFDAVVPEIDTQILVRSDDPDSPEITVPVVGGALLPLLVIDPDPYDFGVVTPGEERDGQVALRNDGNIDLVLDTVLLLAEHATIAEPPTLPLTLGPGQEHSLPLHYAPASRGDEVGQLWAGSTSWLGDTMGTVTGHGGWPGISGQICDPSGNGWVIDAVLWAEVDQDGDGSVDWTTQTRTDADGRYVLQDLPPGTWQVQVEKGSYTAAFEVVIEDAGGVTELAEDICLDPDSVEIAVVTGDWDSVENLVAELGLSYDAYNGSDGLRDLLGPARKLDDYDVLFINCGDYRGLSDELADLGPTLLTWVEAGGSLYASDWAWQLVELTWPDMADFHGQDSIFEGPAVGVAGRIEAEVVDTVMAYAVGSASAEILYDLDAWMVVEAAGPDTDVLVQATVPTFNQALLDAPLALRAEPGGRVIYTTFHNERQLTEDMAAALREIILSL